MAVSFIILISFASLASGQFTNPPPGSGVIEQKPVGITMVYRVGDTLNVQWNNTNGAVVDLVIKQAGTPGTQIDRTPNSAGLTKGAYTWRITIDGSDGGSAFDLTFSNAFRFNLYGTGKNLQSFSTVYFNISNSTIDQYGRMIAQSSSSSTLVPTTLSSITALATSGIPASSTATASATPEPAKSGLATGTKIGLGAGLGIAGLAVIAGLAMWYIFLRRKRSAELNRMSEPVYVDQPKPPVEQGWSPPPELHAPN
ncbi:hypothetical protein BKA65DRAFT_481856 [Rhexocercosporidium sp. MPI-PUGE-AT-0058]|nr:hypothetical protein BKA65DRAFT_481856 [Rhexocercosporidium sp. MPI-PUGE-AT-0058]